MDQRSYTDFKHTQALQILADFRHTQPLQILIAEDNTIKPLLCS